jgi:hypothetical protein
MVGDVIVSNLNRYKPLLELRTFEEEVRREIPGSHGIQIIKYKCVQ